MAIVRDEKDNFHTTGPHKRTLGSLGGRGFLPLLVNADAIATQK